MLVIVGHDVIHRDRKYGEDLAVRSTERKGIELASLCT
jgi:hypothetical protein